MISHLHISKNILASIMLAACALFGAYYAPTAFGGGGGGGGGGSGNCQTCNNVYGGPSCNNGSCGEQYRDMNGNGRLDNGDRVNGGGGGSGGRGGVFSGGGNPPPPPSVQPRTCTLTVNTPAVQLASSTSVTLNWAPKPQGAVTLTRQGTSGMGESITPQTILVANGAAVYSDALSPRSPGTYTYRISYTSNILASALPSENDTQQASLITGASQVAAVTSHGAATPGGAAGGYSGGTGNWGSGGGAGSGGGGGGGGFITTGGHGTPPPAPPPTTYTYSCTAQVRVVQTLTQCNDGLDNSDSEDRLIDAQDPGCHTDGDPKNPTYDPTDNSETNPPADMKPSLMMSGTIAIGRTVSLAPSAENIGEVYAATNDLVIGYRNVTTKPNYCRGSNGLCLEKNGRIFMRIGNPYGRPYVAGQERTAPTQIFTPTQGGRYEICAFADNKDEVNEGTSGELNNETCRVFSVTDVPVDLPTITGPVSLTADPTVVRRGNTSALTWNTGGRLTCVISGTNGQQIPVTTVTGVVPTAAINSQTVYTLRCSDEGYEGSDDAAIRILPTIQEI